MPTARNRPGTEARRVACDGAARHLAAALGHPRVWLQIDENGYVDCGYCDRRFVLKGGPADDRLVVDAASDRDPCSTADRRPRLYLA